MKVNAENDVTGYVRSLAENARKASRKLAYLETERKNKTLMALADLIRKESARLQETNILDLRAGKEKGLDAAMLDRLELTGKRIDSMADGVEEIALLRDPVGEVVAQWKRPGGIEVGQIRIPLGVIAIIYESRPNVTVDAAALCFKAGNATILRGGSEAIHSNRAIAILIRQALEQTEVDPNAVQIVETTDRIAVGELLKLNDLIDVVIPRGGKELIKRVVEESTIPVIKHYEGICHIFVHRDADIQMAVDVVFNAKAQRPGTCNAMETLLVDEPLAAEFLPRIAEKFKSKGVKIHGCARTRSLIEVDREATEDDYRTEYLSLVCNIRVVDHMEQAIDHIYTFGSRHTDAIISRSYETIRQFVQQVDSSSVMVNASTRLSDGGVYGLGAEIGISTDKLHAFGPMGVQELTTKKFVVYGNGALRS